MVDLEKLKKLTSEYQRLSEFLNSQLSSKATLAAQQTENQIVLDELKTLEDDAVVYKAVGPVLLKQATEVSTETVEKRLKYLREEIARFDKIGEDTRKQIDKLASEISSMQKAIQEQRAQQ